MKYLLPCSCGQRIVIERRQAGQTVVCSCGASLQVPTLLRIADLEPAPPETAVAASRTSWGLQQQLRLLGIVVLTAAVLGSGWLYFHQPRSRFDTVDPDHIRQVAKNLPPARTWEIWETMKQGLDRRIDQQYAAAVLRFHAWQTAAGAALLAGIALVAASAAMGGKKRIAA